MEIRIKRVYDAPHKEDGFRVLVDRVWPRGLSKEQVRADRWLKEVAPSSALRKWFGHEPARWPAFKKRYFAELEANSEPIAGLLEQAGKHRLTLLYSARDEEHNQAVALAEYLRRHAKPR